MMFTRLVSGLLVVLAVAAFGTIALGADSSHASGGHGSGNINPTAWEEVQGDLAVWTAAVFLVVLGVLWKFAWGPLAGGLDRREQQVADQIAQAEESNRQAKDLLAQYEQKLVDSKDEIREILDRARHNAEQLSREMLDQAKQEARAEQQRAVQQIDAATAGALKELAERSSTLAVSLAGKILRVELKAEDHSRLIEQAMADFGRSEPSNGGARSN